ncbi:MAG TPA: hypothetical protein PK343_12070 [Giesbergeria sp.]|nr:hypothetical protein [Giesbergeria sp.]
MSDHSNDRDQQELILADEKAARSLLDQLLDDSRLYRTSQDYKNLLGFVARLRNFAPFNAMLLQVQKPGLSYAASARDWRERFERRPKHDARPLVILWPFGPVALVYDVQDTEGKPLPEDVSSFVAHGDVDTKALLAFGQLLAKKRIHVTSMDAGDRSAGRIRVTQRAADQKDWSSYSIDINRNHPCPAQFTTLTHELAHLTLGHLGPDKKLNIPQRPRLTHAQQELEAESVAYLVCERNGVQAKSQTYLSNFVGRSTTTDGLDVYQIMRAAGAVEILLGLGTHTRFDMPSEMKQIQGDKQASLFRTHS